MVERDAGPYWLLIVPSLLTTPELVES